MRFPKPDAQAQEQVQEKEKEAQTPEVEAHNSGAASQAEPAPAYADTGSSMSYNPSYANTNTITTPVAPAAPAPPSAEWPAVKLRLEVKDLGHEGARLFFAHVPNVADALAEAVRAVLEVLYTKQSCPRNVRSVTLYLEDMEGVAYTRGSELDNDHKEIHLSLRHVVRSRARVGDEVQGVLVHEMVHCFQYNAKGTCPGGLIEGIADYVRLKAKLNPPHWKRGGNRWDEGYQTTAYWLEWIEEEKMGGREFVRQLNGAMREHKYTNEIFKGMTGEDVESLWKAYKASLELKLDGRRDAERERGAEDG